MDNRILIGVITILVALIAFLLLGQPSVSTQPLCGNGVCDPDDKIGCLEDCTDCAMEGEALKPGQECCPGLTRPQDCVVDNETGECIFIEHLMDMCVDCSSIECDKGSNRCLCPQDCGGSASSGSCGDGTCDTGENQKTCPGDCNLTGKPPIAAKCGNQICEAGETAASCPADCNNSAQGTGDILVSMRVDDPYFGEQERPFLETIVSLARDYDVKFDIAVVAWPFDHLADPGVFSIYTNNTDVLELVAHGYRHIEVVNWTYGWDDNYGIILPMGQQLAGYNQYANHNEFGDTTNIIVPRATQEALIRDMRDVFARHGMTTATQIFLAPFVNGNRDTVDLASEYGYKYISTEAMGVPACMYENMIVTSSQVIAQPSVGDIERIADLGYRHVVAIFHPSDFHPSRLSALKTRFFDQFRSSRYYSRMRFVFISEGVNGGYYGNLAPCPANAGLLDSDGTTKLALLGSCGDGICDGAAGEKISCPQDCHL